MPPVFFFVASVFNKAQRDSLHICNWVIRIDESIREHLPLATIYKKYSNVKGVGIMRATGMFFSMIIIIFLYMLLYQASFHIHLFHLCVISIMAD